MTAAAGAVKLAPRKSTPSMRMNQSLSPLRVLGAVLACLYCAIGTAQVVAPNNRARLAPIADAAVSGIKPIALGETRVDFSGLNPSERAELLRLLAAAPNEVRLQAWNGETASADSAELQIDQDRVRIDASSTDGIWWFEYVNNGRSAVRARWQLSRLPFPQDMNDWRTPPGLVAQGEVPNVLRGNQANRFKLQVGYFFAGVDARRLDIQNSPGQTVTSMLHSQFPTGRLYLRVLALGRSSTPVAWPSNSVVIEVAAGATQPGEAAGMAQVLPAATLQPARVAELDHQCHFTATRDFELPAPAAPGQIDPGPAQTIKAGQSVNACLPAPQGLLGNFEAFQGSAAFVDALINNWDGDRYKHARDAAYEVVFRNFGGPEGGCNSHCRQALGLALDRGAAVVGIPAGSSRTDPTADAAAEYLRLLMRDALRISDLPAVVHEQASTRAINEFRAAMQAVSHAAPPPFEPDPSRLGSPARLTLILQAGETESAPGQLQIRETSRQARVADVLLAVPAIPAGQQLSVPVRLHSSEIPEHQQLTTIAPIDQLTAGIGDATELMQRVEEQLRDRGKQHKQLEKRQVRGNYEFELAWRSAEGELVQALRLRCKASSGECRAR